MWPLFSTCTLGSQRSSAIDLDETTRITPYSTTLRFRPHACKTCGIYSLARLLPSTSPDCTNPHSMSSGADRSPAPSVCYQGRPLAGGVYEAHTQRCKSLELRTPNSGRMMRAPPNSVMSACYSYASRHIHADAHHPVSSVAQAARKKQMKTLDEKRTVEASQDLRFASRRTTSSISHHCPETIQILRSLAEVKKIHLSGVRLRRPEQTTNRPENDQEDRSVSTSCPLRNVSSRAEYPLRHFSIGTD